MLPTDLPFRLVLSNEGRINSFNAALMLPTRDGSYGVGVLYVVSYLSRIYPYFSNCSV